MRINEIFYSIQGEGFHTGTPAVFVRFSGCNLRCAFCDTDHQPCEECTEEDVCAEIAKYPARMVVVTGGEPALQLTASLVEKIHAMGKIVAVETNATKPLPEGVDWVTASPKQVFVGRAGTPVLHHAHEVKVIFDDTHAVSDAGILAEHYFVQPCDTGDAERNQVIADHCVQFVKDNPKWRLSLQTHKILHIR